MASIFTKRVTMIELFYDLVFVYMLSQATGLIHHLNHGVVDLTTCLLFMIIIIIFINSWMVQTVYTNRYGQSSWLDIFISFFDMMVVLYLSNSFTNWQNHQAFFLAASLLSLTLCLQYFTAYWRTTNPQDRRITRIFIAILGFRTLTLLIGGLIPNNWGILIALSGVIISWLAPGFTGTYTQAHPIVFSHLLERLTLLIIITFGEMIVGIARYFTPSTLSGRSILIFSIVASLFFTYITEFDHLIEAQRTHETGNFLIYLHYPILFGISLITVGLNFISDSQANLLFTTSWLYLGFLLFYSGISLANHYNQPQYKLSSKLIMSLFLLILAGFGLSLAFATMPALLLISTLVTLSLTALVVRSLLKA